jgi:hypothetical protein
MWLVACFPTQRSGFEPMFYKHASSGIPTGNYQLELVRVIVQAVSGLLQTQLPGFTPRVYKRDSSGVPKVK